MTRRDNTRTMSSTTTPPKFRLSAGAACHRASPVRSPIASYVSTTFAHFIGVPIDIRQVNAAKSPGHFRPATSTVNRIIPSIAAPSATASTDLSPRRGDVARSVSQCPHRYRCDCRCRLDSLVYGRRWVWIDWCQAWWCTEVNHNLPLRCFWRKATDSIHPLWPGARQWRWCASPVRRCNRRSSPCRLSQAVFGP